MGVFSFVKAGGKKFGSIVGTGPKVNKTKLDTAKSELAKSQQTLKGSTAKLKQTQFEIKNKLPITFGKSNKKTMSNTELRKAAEARKKEKKQETKTKHFYAPENFNKGGRVGLMAGGGADMGANKVTETATTPEPISSTNQMDFQTLRARLPKEITDDIVKLLSVSPEAFEDFATIQTQQDVDTFNKKYDVNLVLPAEA